MQHLIIIGIWVPIISRTAGVLPLPPRIETPWCFLLVTLALAAALRKGTKAGFLLLVEAFAVCALLAIFPVGASVLGTESSALDLGVLYGRLGAYTTLLMLNLLPVYYREVGRRKPAATMERASSRSAEFAAGLLDPGVPGTESSVLGLVALALVLDVLFVTKLREVGLAMSLAALPGLALVVGRAVESSVLGTEGAVGKVEA